MFQLNAGKTYRLFGPLRRKGSIRKNSNSKSIRRLFLRSKPQRLCVEYLFLKIYLYLFKKKNEI